MSVKPFSPERQRQLVGRAQQGDRAARDLLVTSNRGLVAELARGYAARGVEFEDLLQEGTLGLMRAVEKFDLDRPVRFSTYAAWWIKQALGRACEQHGSSQLYGYRLPAHVIHAMGRIARERGELERRLGREATPAELAAVCEISDDAAEQALRMKETPSTTSLQEDLGEDGAQLANVVAAPVEDTDAVELIDQQDRRAALREMLRRMPDAERELLNRRYGLDGSVPASERELTEEWGVDRAQLQATRTAALRRLRRDPQLATLHGEQPLSGELQEAVSRSLMRQTCGHLRPHARPEDLGLDAVSVMSERAVTGRVAGGWWLVSRPASTERWQVQLLDGQDGDLLSPSQAARRMSGEQLIEAAAWMRRMPMLNAEDCDCCHG